MLDFRNNPMWYPLHANVPPRSRWVPPTRACLRNAKFVLRHQKRTSVASLVLGPYGKTGVASGTNCGLSS